MANSAGISGKFKQVAMANLLDGKSNIYAALYYATASISGATAGYTTSGEVSGTGYVAKGEQVTNANSVGLGGTPATIAFWSPSANIVYSGITIATAFDCVLLFDDDQTSPQVDLAIGAFTFGSQTVNNGDFTLTVPAHTVGAGLVRFN